MEEAITPENNQAHQRANAALDQLFAIPSIRYDSDVYKAAYVLQEDPDNYLYGNHPSDYDPEAAIRAALFKRAAEVCSPLAGRDPATLTEADAKQLRDALDIVASLEAFAEHSRNTQPPADVAFLANVVANPALDIED